MFYSCLTDYLTCLEMSKRKVDLKLVSMMLETTKLAREPHDRLCLYSNTST